MKKLLFLIVALSLFSCSTIKLSEYNAAVKSASSSATLVCNSASLFSGVVGHKPGVTASSECLRIVDKLGHDDFQTVVAAAGCAYRYSNKIDLADCLIDINWHPLSKKLAGIK